MGGTAPPLGPEAEPPNPAFNQNCNDASCSCHEVDFPYDKLQSLDEKISSPRWIVPVLPDQELECLIEAAINLCRSGKRKSILIGFPTVWKTGEGREFMTVGKSLAIP